MSTRLSGHLMAPLDKTSPVYWSDLWSHNHLPQAIDLGNTTYLNRNYHKVFGQLLTMFSTPRHAARDRLRLLGLASPFR